MAQFLRVAPVLRVNSRTFPGMRDFFVEQPGFTVGTEIRHFATLDRDGLTVMLDCKAVFGWRRGWAAYFWVEDVEAIYSEVSDAPRG